MKNNFYKAAFVAVFLFVLLAGANICQAQRAGGFKEADTADKAVISAADFAVETKAKDDASLKLVSILSVEQQVVAGMNYRVCMAIETKDGAGQAQATVYVNLKNVYSLSEWKLEKCAAAENSENQEILFSGTLELGEIDSAIVYVGKETGDVAAYCFTNKSDIGRAILAACTKGEQCEVTGTIDGETACTIKDERELSSSGKIMTIKKVAPQKAGKQRARAGANAN